MRVRHFKSDYRYTASVTGKRFFNCFCDRFRKQQNPGKIHFIQVKKMIGLHFRNYQGMASAQWTNIEKCKKKIIFGNPVSRDFTFYNLCKYCHDAKVRL